ncbi:MAG: carbon-nitrogen hydrolase family protein [Mariniblastus sp.]
MSRFKVAGVQMDIEFAAVSRNLEKMEGKLSETVANGAALTVFPECTTTGYCFDSLEEAKQVGESLDGPSVMAVQNWCASKTTMVIFGFLELKDDCLYNSLALIGPSGLIGSYRKIHLPFLGVDRFTTPGGCPPVVFETPDLRVGMNICYDSSFPESARILAIEGADLIALPTNWPPTSGLTADLIPNARALENHVYFMSVNRVGVERGFEFIGKSKICDPRGANLAFENHAEEAILYAEIDSDFARKKHLVSIPGAHEVHRMNDRRPDLYRSLADPVEDVAD